MTLYAPVSVALVCAHEHSVTRQPAQMSHVWLHSRETVRGLCALMSVSLVLLGGHIRAERLQQQSDDAMIWANCTESEEKEEEEEEEEASQFQTFLMATAGERDTITIFSDTSQLGSRLLQHTNEVVFFPAYIDSFAGVMNKRSGLVK